MRNHKTVLTISLILPSLIFFAQNAWTMKAEGLLEQRCAGCHQSIGEAAPINSAQFTTSQWEEFFNKNKHDQFKVLNLLTKKELSEISNYLKTHAAGSDNPDEKEFEPIDIVLSRKSLSRQFDPIEISGEMISPLLGKPLENMAVYAFKEGRLQQIPYQLDERTEKNTFILAEGPRGKINGANSILDARDLLTFMSSDCGPKVKSRQLPTGCIRAVEIEIRDKAAGTKSWAYLLYFNNTIPTVMTESKVSFPKGGKAYKTAGKSWMLEGMMTTVRGKEHQSVLNQKFRIFKSAGGNGINFLDRMKARAKVELLFGTMKFGFDESSVIGGMESYKVGKVRNLGVTWLQMVYSSGLRAPKFRLDILTYDYIILIPVYVNVFFNPGYIVTNFQNYYGYDLNESARGMKFYNSNNLQGFEIDGKMSDAELNFDPKMDKWRLVTGPQGTMINVTVWDPSFAEQADIEAHYSDDVNVIDPPEDVPGDFGSFATKAVLESLEPGRYSLLTGWFMPPDFYDPERLKVEVIKEFFDIWESPLEISVDRGVGFTNTGGTPAPLH